MSNAPSRRGTPEARAQRHQSRAASTYTRFLDDLTVEAGWSRAEAERFAAGVIATLEERLIPGEGDDLEAQLPSLLRERLRSEDIGASDLEMTFDEFIGRVASRLDVDIDDVEPIVRMVFRALGAHISSGEAHHIERQLPDELRRLWNRPSFGRR